MGLQPCFPFFLFGKYFHSRVAAGRTPHPKPPVIKLGRRAKFCHFWHYYLRHFSLVIRFEDRQVGVVLNSFPLDGVSNAIKNH